MTNQSRGTQYAVYADFSRQLTNEERSAVGEALDANVPEGGCVGHHKRHDNDEVYFSIQAPSHEGAIELAAQYMRIVVQEAGLKTKYTLTVQRIPMR